MSHARCRLTQCYTTIRMRPVGGSRRLGVGVDVQAMLGEAIEKICGTGCEQYKDLAKAISENTRS